MAECIARVKPHGQLLWLEKVLPWPVWLKEGDTVCLFPHYLYCLSFHPSPYFFCTSEPKSFRAVPGQRTQQHVRHLTLTHYSPSFLCLCQPSTSSSSRRLSWTVACFCFAKSCIQAVFHPSLPQSCQAEVAEVFKMVLLLFPKNKQ